MVFLNKEEVIQCLKGVYTDQYPEIVEPIISKVNDAKFLTLSKIFSLRPVIYYTKWVKKPNELVLFDKFFNKLKNLKGKTKVRSFPEGSVVLYRVVNGSQAYGTATETSDIDIKGVFLCDPREKMVRNVPDTISINKDENYYEFSYYVELLIKGDVIALEMLFAPKECQIDVNPIFKQLLENRNLFLTKNLYYKLYGFAMKQFKKSNNYNKMVNWDDERVRRKNPSEFCNFISSISSKPVSFIKFLAENKINVDEISLVKNEGFINVFKVYLHPSGGWFSDNSNELKVSSVPKEAELLGLLHFNHPEYSKHCLEYKNYQTWLKERNNERYINNKGHEQNYDSKNVQHTVRLLISALRLPKDLDFNIDMSEHRGYLLSIKRGELNLADVLTEWDLKTKNLSELYQESDLLDGIDFEKVKKIQRNIIYGFVK